MGRLWIGGFIGCDHCVLPPDSGYRGFLPHHKVFLASGFLPCLCLVILGGTGQRTKDLTTKELHLVPWLPAVGNQQKSIWMGNLLPPHEVQWSQCVPVQPKSSWVGCSPGSPLHHTAPTDSRPAPPSTEGPQKRVSAGFFQLRLSPSRFLNNIAFFWWLSNRFQAWRPLSFTGASAVSNSVQCV